VGEEGAINGLWDESSRPKTVLKSTDWPIDWRSLKVDFKFAVSVIFEDGAILIHIFSIIRGNFVGRTGTTVD